MKCPKCRTENPEGAKFCIECGKAMEFRCPKCGAITPAKGRFCMECGHNITLPAQEPPLKDTSFDEKITRIQRYLPKGLTAKILSQRHRIEGEKKQVTVMFCDMEGFTPLSEKLGPEGVYTLMDQIYEILIHKVHDYEGTVNELTGDGIMALFGAPIALEDAPQRAIRSAIAIHKEITRFNERVIREKRTPPIRMRIGIHSGPVVVGTLGNDLRVDFKVVGETVNLASRMEGLAEPGTIYVTEETFKLTEGLFRFEGLGERRVKGKEAPLRVYQVIAPSTRRTRFDVIAERGLTSFVGRDRELELLLDGFARVKEGAGQAFSIIGEAGIGKSRFLYEFRKAVCNEDITFLEGKCLSYGKGVPYHPISDVLKGNFEIGEDDTDDRIRKNVKRSLEVLKADEATTLPYLLELLGVKDSGIEKIPMSPEGRRDRIIEAVKQIILMGARIRPLIMAIEDLHWADKSTEDALKWLLESVPGAKVFVIFTYRPEFVHTWGGRSYHNQITLNRLSNRESILMVSHLLGMNAIDPELQKLILSKTEGVPFFIEEFVQSLQGLEVIKRENGKVRFQGDPQSIAIPSTIQDMVMARVDRLSDGAKAVLQAGSVIEREFPHDLIRTVTGFPEEELLSCLSALKDAELLYERGVYPQTSYIFRHALTREVVYGSILARRRRELHGRIGTAIEELHEDNLADHYEILSEHFYQSEDYAKAAEYSTRAARKAEKSASMPDAIAHARKRVLCVEKSLKPGAQQRELIDARTVLGFYLAQINHLVEAREAVEPVVESAAKEAHWRRLGQIRAIMGVYNFMVEEDFLKAVESYEDALRLSAGQGDTVTSVLANYWLGITQGNFCDFDNARKSIERAVDITVAAGSSWGTATMKANLAYCYCFYSGRIDTQARISAEALHAAQESGDVLSRGMAHTSHGVSHYAKRQLLEGEKHLLEGKRLCERVGLYTFCGAACSTLAETYFQMGDFGKSRDHYDQALGYWKRGQLFPSLVRWAWLGMTRCDVMKGDGKVDLESLYSVQKTNRMRAFEGSISRYVGEILLNIDDRHMPESEHWIKKAVDVDEKNGTRFSLGLSHALYAEFFKRQGNIGRARETLGKAIDILRECGADGWVEKYERELAALQ
jgi:class 3 adenylate cyclase/tetratricopeptide (TPR) repeat protein